MTPDEPTDPRVVCRGHAPTPFTAAEIRRGCPVGRTTLLRIEPAAGTRGDVHRLNVFMASDDDGAVIERAAASADGVRLDEPVVDRPTWRQLQEHASYPAEQTTIETESLETPMGVLECLRYTVADGSDVTTLWFADRAPGMPVKSIETRAGQIVSTMAIVADSQLSRLD